MVKRSGFAPAEKDERPCDCLDGPPPYSITSPCMYQLDPEDPEHKRIVGWWCRERIVRLKKALELALADMHACPRDHNAGATAVLAELERGRIP